MDFLTRFVEAWKDQPVGTLFSIILVGCFLAFVVLVVYKLYAAVDSCSLPRKRTMGRIVGKEYTPAHTETIWIYNAATKTPLPNYFYHPDSWGVSVEVEGQKDSIEVSKEFFDSLSENDPVLAECARGRFSGALYVKDLSRV